MMVNMCGMVEMCVNNMNIEIRIDDVCVGGVCMNIS